MKLWKKEDLQWIDDLYTLLWNKYAPGHEELSAEEFKQFCPSDMVRRRLEYLLAHERAFSVLNPQGTIRVNEGILERPTLADYLTNRYFRSFSLRSPDDEPRAEVEVRGLRVRNFRTLRDVKLESIPRFSVLAGPNEAGKTNVLRALRFASRCAAKGIAEAIKDAGDLEAIIAKDASPRDAVEIELEFSIPSANVASGGKYLLLVDRDPRTPIVRELLHESPSSEAPEGRDLVDSKPDNGNGLPRTTWSKGGDAFGRQRVCARILARSRAT